MGANFGHVYEWESCADISYFELSKNITRLVLVFWPTWGPPEESYLK